jgi:hypothetical protein
VEERKEKGETNREGKESKKVFKRREFVKQRKH